MTWFIALNVVINMKPDSWVWVGFPYNENCFFFFLKKFKLFVPAQSKKHEQMSCLLIVLLLETRNYFSRRKFIS